MKPHPRLRKTVQWGGAAISLLLASAWLTSGWWFIARFGADVSTLPPRLSGWLLSEGTLMVFSDHTPTGQPASAARWLTFDHPFHLDWWYDWQFQSTGWYFRVPLWVLFLPVAAGTTIAWRNDLLARRRARLGCCARCGYALSGLATCTPCPECGASRAPTATAQPSQQYGR